MGLWIKNLAQKGAAHQARLQRAKEQRTERVPSRLMHAIYQDLESATPPKREKVPKCPTK
jgi:hypothetical protein